MTRRQTGFKEEVKKSQILFFLLFHQVETPQTSSDFWGATYFNWFWIASYHSKLWPIGRGSYGDRGQVSIIIPLPFLGFSKCHERSATLSYKFIPGHENWQILRRRKAKRHAFFFRLWRQVSLMAKFEWKFFIWISVPRKCYRFHLSINEIGICRSPQFVQTSEECVKIGWR